MLPQLSCLPCGVVRRSAKTLHRHTRRHARCESAVRRSLRIALVEQPLRLRGDDRPEGYAVGEHVGCITSRVVHISWCPPKRFSRAVPTLGLERKELHFEGAASMSSESSYSLPQVSV